VLLFCRLRQGIFLFFAISSLVLEPVQPPSKRLLGALTCGVKLLEHEAEHLQLVLTLRMHGTVPPLSPCDFMEWEATNLPFTNKNMTSKLTVPSNITPVYLCFMHPSLLIFVILRMQHLDQKLCCVIFKKRHACGRTKPHSCSTRSFFISDFICSLFYGCLA